MIEPNRSINPVLLVLVYSLLAASFLYPAAELYSDSDIRNIDKKSDVLVINSSRDSVSVEINNYGFTSEIMNAGGEQYERIRIKGCSRVSETGYPELPYIRKLIAIPECSDLDTNIQYSDTVELTDINIYPVPELVEGYHCLEEQFSISDDAYNSDRYFPGNKPAIIKNVFKIRNQKVAEVHIYPIKYNPVKKTAVFIKDIDLTLSFEDPASEVSVNAGPFQKVCENALLNYDYLGGLSQNHILGFQSGNYDDYTSLEACANNNTDYLMVVGHDLWDTLTTQPDSLNCVRLLAKKRAEYNGFNVSIIDIENIINNSAIQSASADSMLKLELMAFYDSMNTAAHMQDGKLGYILLIGDAYKYSCTDTTGEGNYDCEYESTIIPTHCNTQLDYDPASDLYYAAMDSEADIAPDIFVGRISVDDTLEARAFISKIINYEPHTKDDSTEYPWYEKALFVGGQEVSSNENDKLHTISSECELNTPMTFEYDAIFRENSDTDPFQGDSLNPRINDGVLFVCEAGHGDSYYWGNGGTVYQPNYYEILNNDNYPIFFANSCMTCKFDIANMDSGEAYPNSAFDSTTQQSVYSPAAPGLVDVYDCMAERLTVLEDKGAVAYFGYSRYGSTVEFGDRTVAFYKQFVSGYNSLGELLNSFYYLYDTDNYQIVLLGDPALNPFFAVEPDSTEHLPDLTVSLLLNSLLFDIDEQQTIDVIVKNNGNEDASNVEVIIEVDGEEVDSEVISSLLAYHKDTLQLDPSITDIGHYSLSAIVNPDSLITEHIYWNNVADTSITAADINSGFPIQQHTHNTTILPYNCDSTEDVEILVHTWIWPGDKYLRKIKYDGSIVDSMLLDGSSKYYQPSISNITYQHHENIVIINKKNFDVILSIYNVSDFEFVDSTIVELPFGSDHQIYSALYDVDKDGRSEILCAYGYKNIQSNQSGVIKTIDYSDGDLNILADSLLISYHPKSFSIEDIDFDNSAEVAVLGLTEYNIILGIYDYNNWTIKGSKTVTVDTNYVNAQYGKVIISDINNDQHQDVLAAINSELIIFDGSDSTFSEFYNQSFTADTNSLYTNLCIADFSGDGNKEIVFVYGDYIKILSYNNGSISQNYSKQLDYVINSGPLTSDIDGDSNIEIIIGASYIRKPYEPDHYRIFIFNSQLEEENDWQNICIYGLSPNIHKNLLIEDCSWVT